MRCCARVDEWMGRGGSNHVCCSLLNTTLTPHVPRTFLFPSDVPFEEFQDIAYVSEGSGSMVFEAVWRGHQVVIKVIATTKAKDPIVLQEFEMEKVPEPYYMHTPPTVTSATRTMLHDAPLLAARHCPLNAFPLPSLQPPPLLRVAEPVDAVGPSTCGPHPGRGQAAAALHRAGEAQGRVHAPRPARRRYPAHPPSLFHSMSSLLSTSLLVEQWPHLRMPCYPARFTNNHPPLTPRSPQARSVPRA